MSKNINFIPFTKSNKKDVIISFFFAVAILLAFLNFLSLPDFTINPTIDRITMFFVPSDTSIFENRLVDSVIIVSFLVFGSLVVKIRLIPVIIFGSVSIILIILLAISDQEKYIEIFNFLVVAAYLIPNTIFCFVKKKISISEYFQNEFGTWYPYSRYNF